MYVIIDALHALHEFTTGQKGVPMTTLQMAENLFQLSDFLTACLTIDSPFTLTFLPAVTSA